MGTCWYCYWGWAKPVADIYRRTVEAITELNEPDDDGNYADGFPVDPEMALEYGPAHIVWSDENWDDHSIKFCLKECDKPDEQYGPAVTQVIRQSLVELLAVPGSQREIVPKNYDDENPANFPPLVEVDRVR